MKLIDIGHILGFDGSLEIEQDGFEKNFDSLSLWNPLLIAIGRKEEAIVRYIFLKVKGFHKINCLSKPYSLEQ